MLKFYSLCVAKLMLGCTYNRHLVFYSFPEIFGESIQSILFVYLYTVKV